MKVISIRQPWATLIAKGYKKYEFRSWKTKYRGQILIHASLGIDKDILNRFAHYNLEYPAGMIIAKAKLTDCIEVNKTFENELIKENETIYGAKTEYRTGYAFELENVEELENPIPVKGQLGLWEYKDV